MARARVRVQAPSVHRPMPDAGSAVVEARDYGRAQFGHASSIRSQLIPDGGQFVTAYEAASAHPSIPTPPDIGPIDATRYQPVMQRLARQMSRNNSWIKRILQILEDTVVATGPTPRSNFPELDDLFMACAPRFDTRGVNGWGGWLRRDVYRPSRIDGEMFIRRRDRTAAKYVRKNLGTPLQFQSLVSDYVPIQHMTTMAANNNRIVAGIEFQTTSNGVVTDERVAYHMYRVHPRDYILAQGGGDVYIRVPADEVYHLFEPPMSGSPRGEVPLAAAIITALQTSTYLDAQLRRKILSQFLSCFIETPLDAEGSDLPGEEQIDELLSQVMMEPGLIFRLPPGMKVNMPIPPEASTPDDWYTKFNIASMCATMGVPVHEVTQDYSAIGNDRIAKFIGLRFKMTVDVERQRIEDQVLNRLRADFVDYAIATGMWTPPAGIPDWRLYYCDWDWPVVQLSQLTQDLGVLLKAEQQGMIDRDWIRQSYFGRRGAEVDRALAKAEARWSSLGLVSETPRWQASTKIAASIAEEAATEEMGVRDLVDESSSDSAAAGNTDGVIGSIAPDPNAE